VFIFNKKFKNIEYGNGCWGAELQPVWLIVNDPEISIICKGATTPTYFVKVTTSVASLHKYHRSMALPVIARG
jgi:hypothetical protein